jgi:2-dehydro-3-deoxygalactonokinase
VSGSLVIGDWGSTRLRLWRVEAGRAVERREGTGMLDCGDPAQVLASAMDGWAPDRVILSGMAGARGGLHEAPYLPCPVTSDKWRAATVNAVFRGSRLRIAAGLACRDSSGRPEVMRGEEAQLFGAMALDPGLASGKHLILLPGTHSKWVRLDEGAITEFRTWTTGELFALLGNSSLLAGCACGIGEDEGFAAGLVRAREGRALSSALFEARSVQLVDSKSGAWARGFVSGLLIGAEIADAAPQELVRVIGDEALIARYADALAHSRVEARLIAGETCAIAGLRLLDGD